MDEREADDLIAILAPLLQSLELLGFVARHFHPGELSAVLAAAEGREAALAEALPRLQTWSEPLAGLRALLSQAAGQVLGAYEELRGAAGTEAEVGGAYRALRRIPRAQEALYPLASGLAPVNRYFLPPELRADAEIQARLLNREAAAGTGPIHVDNAPGSRGGYSMYAPEDYSADRPWPLIVALHGGSGHGRPFVWTWLREARGGGAIVIAPTSLGRTWALSDPDADAGLIARAVADAGARWNIDPQRLLLTGMSDGGTFTYVAGLDDGSPFTHLAPISAAFHPVLAAAVSPERARDLPIFISHGGRDWMFPAASAREAAQLLSAAGAAVIHRQVDDLSHTYPAELNVEILRWLFG